MARPGAVAAAIKAIPGGARYTPAPQSSGMGRISPVQAESYFANPYAASYGPFLDRPSSVFTDGAFAPMSPIQPVPVDEPPPGGRFPDPRWWQYRTGWNLPTPPGSEGLKLASFEQLRTLAEKYSVARQCIELRKEEIRGLEWEIALTTDAAKAYQGDRAAMRDFGERKAEATKFFRHPDPDFWSFASFLDALLEEIFVYDALSLVFRPKFGASFGMGGRGLLGSDLDSLRLVSGPTIRPLLDLHGGRPRPPAPAYQQFLYGVPRSDYMTLATGADIDDAGLAGAEVNRFDSDVMLYAPLVQRRETPYGFPPVERALLPIISGLQKQQYQLDYFQEGTVPAVYISPGDPNITPAQIGELQSALNALAGDSAYHLKVVVLPPGSKVEPQRPVDLSDSFDYLVMNQVAMAFDIQPQELGIIPNVGATPVGPSASGIRFAGQESRDPKSRKSTKPLLKFIADIFNYAIQDVCRQPDMQFQFEGLVDDEDKAAITQLGVEQVQNGISSIDEIRERLDLPPWGLQETSEPVVFTAQGPIPFSMAPQLIAAMQGAGQGTNSGQRTTSSRSRTSQPSVRRGGQTKPNGSHPAPVAPHREVTPGHTAAAGAIQSPTPRTGGTTSRSSVAGSRKKAAAAEFGALKRHLRKGREITSWEPVHITGKALAVIAEDLAKGVLLDTAVDRALDMTAEGGWLAGEPGSWDGEPVEPVPAGDPDRLRRYSLAGLPAMKASRFPGWEHDLGLIGACKQEISRAFAEAEGKAAQLRKDAATGKMMVTSITLQGLVSDAVRDAFLHVMTPMQEKAWHLGYESAKALVTGQQPDFSAAHDGDALQGFLDTEGRHWLDQVSRTGLKNPASRGEMIARTEVARALNAAALQCYRDHGVAYKHLGVAPDERACQICADAAEDGVIPLDAPFSAGGLSGPLHPACRCVPLPAGAGPEPPLAHLGKSADHQYARCVHSGAGNCECGRGEDDHPPGSEQEDEDHLAWLLIRARDEDGKWRYLLQQRPDGSWGMPGGTAHLGESGYTAAYRETFEEIGEFPQLTVVRDFSHDEPDGKRADLYLAETGRVFKPGMNGSTPDETMAAGWFRRKEISGLNLAPKFRDDWENEPPYLKEALKEDGVAKQLQNLVSETGEQMVLDDPGRHGAGLGARWPYPRRGDGTEVPEGHWRDAGPGAVPGSSAGGEPPRQGPQDLADHGEARIYPRGSQDDRYPRRRARNDPAGRFPGQDGEGKYPQGGIGTEQPARSGIPKRAKVSKQSVNYRLGTPSRQCGNCAMYGGHSCELVRGHIEPADVCDEWVARASEKARARIRSSQLPLHPAAGEGPFGGPVPALTPHPYEPHAVGPVVMAPDANEEMVGEEGDSPVHHILPVRQKGAQHASDPNPVEWRHVYAQLEQNFPAEAIEWVKRARWIGPVNIPWSRVDDDDIDSWAASHQPDAVNRFARNIKAGAGHTNPSILVQEPHTNRAFIVDGHHRALARRKLGKPVLAYVGNIDPGDREAAEETHSSQVHAGSDPGNR